jgi:hypothetical protein
MDRRREKSLNNHRACGHVDEPSSALLTGHATVKIGLGTAGVAVPRPILTATPAMVVPRPSTALPHRCPQGKEDGERADTRSPGPPAWRRRRRRGRAPASPRQLPTVRPRQPVAAHGALHRRGRQFYAARASGPRHRQRHAPRALDRRRCQRRAAPGVLGFRPRRRHAAPQPEPPVRWAVSRDRTGRAAALTPAFAGPYHRCFGAISAPNLCLPSTLTGLRESFP